MTGACGGVFVHDSVTRMDPGARGRAVKYDAL